MNATDFFYQYFENCNDFQITPAGYEYLKNIGINTKDFYYIPNEDFYFTELPLRNSIEVNNVMKFVDMSLYNLLDCEDVSLFIEDIRKEILDYLNNNINFNF